MLCYLVYCHAACSCVSKRPVPRFTTRTRLPRVSHAFPTIWSRQCQPFSTTFHIVEVRMCMREREWQGFSVGVANMRLKWKRWTYQLIDMALNALTRCDCWIYINTTGTTWYIKTFDLSYWTPHYLALLAALILFKNSVMSTVPTYACVPTSRPPFNAHFHTETATALYQGWQLRYKSLHLTADSIRVNPRLEDLTASYICFRWIHMRREWPLEVTR